MSRGVTGWSVPARGCFSACVLIASILAALSHPWCYHTAHRRYLDAISYRQTLNRNGDSSRSTPTGRREEWRCLDVATLAFEYNFVTGVNSSSHSEELVSSPEAHTEYTQEADAIFHRLSVMGILVMLTGGIGMLGAWVFTDEPETLANACIYFVVNGIAIGVFGYVSVGYFYTSLLGIVAIGVAVFLAMKKQQQQ